MNRKIHNLMCCVFVSLLLNAPALHAVQVGIEPDYEANRVIVGGELIGADDIFVNGISYSLRFVDGSCLDLFNGCTSFVIPLNDVNDAVDAILNQVFFGGSSDPYDSMPELTRGCEDSASCTIQVPHTSFGSQVSVSGATNYPGITPPDGPVNGIRTQAEDLTDIPDMTYAVFTPTVIPLPAAAWLFGSAVLGLGVVKRRKK